MSDLLRAGGVGCDRIIRTAQVPVYAGRPGVQVTTFYDPDGESGAPQVLETFSQEVVAVVPDARHAGIAIALNAPQRLQ